MQELDVEDLLACHPYLICPSLEKLIPLRQLTRGAGRLDLAFQTETGLSIVELKKVPLEPKHVSQLLGYCRSWGRRHKLANRHYLIGKKPKRPEEVEKAIARSSRDIRVCFFGDHIPTTLMMLGRRYRQYDEAVYSSNIIQLKL